MLQVFTLSYLGTNAKMGSLGRLSATCPDLQAAMLEGRVGFQALEQKEGGAHRMTAQCWIHSGAGPGGDERLALSQRSCHNHGSSKLTLLREARGCPALPHRYVNPSTESFHLPDAALDSEAQDMLVPPLPKAFRLPLEEVSAKAVFRD